MQMHIRAALRANRGFPCEMVPACGLVVVADEDTRGIGQFQQPVDGAIELACRAARKIAARRAVVRHEQRIA